MIPPLDQNGHLPPGNHPATIEEVEARFGRRSEARRVQMESLRWLIEASKRVEIRRIVLDGSFATDRLEPNDVDCALMVGPAITPDVEALGEIPFLHILILDAASFDRVLEDVFGTDYCGIQKGYDRGDILELTSLVEVRNTREKLRKLEELHEDESRTPAENAYARELSLRSLGEMIEQLRQEIARFERNSTGHDPEIEAPASETSVRSTEAG